MSDLEKIKGLHGGYWRYDFLDFYYLYNHYFPPRKLVETLQKELPRLMDSYPSTPRFIEGLLSAWKDEDYFCPENLVVGNGSSELIRALNSIINKATIPLPTFNEYVQLPPEKMNLLYLKEEEKFRLNVDELLKSAKDSRSDFIVLNNPNNPVGNVIGRQEVEKILQSGIKTIVDEAFIDFASDYSVEDLVGKYDNLIVVKSMTKCAGTAGLRIGYLLTTNQEVKTKVKNYLAIWNINSLAERFIELFPDFKEDYLLAIKKTIEDRDELFERLKEISFLEPYPSLANFVFCKTALSAKKIGQDLFEKHRILIKDGLSQKDIKSDRYIRIAVRPKPDTDKLIAGLRGLA